MGTLRPLGRGTRDTSWWRRLRLPTQPLARHLVLALLGAALLYLITSSLSPYNDFEVGEIALFVIALAGLSLLTGVNGQISLGHGAFMAVGAYTAALLMTHTHLNFLVELLASIGGAALLGLVIGIPATRLKGPYLAGMTLLLALALPPIADKWSTTFGGDQGLTTTVPSAPGTVNPEEWLAWIQIIGALIVLVLLANLLRSRFGRSFRAVRDDEIAASLAGIHVARTKVIAFVISAACAGLAGSLFAYWVGITAPTGFGLQLSLQLLSAIVIGGLGSLSGAVLGAFFLVWLPVWTSNLAGNLNLSSDITNNLPLAVYGAVLVLAMLVLPSGIRGAIASLLRPVSRWLATTRLYQRNMEVDP
jgi:branched-chain amino acid transport system permease protein